MGTPSALPAAVEGQLLRIGQEAITNTLKHAQASKLKVDLYFEPERIPPEVVAKLAERRIAPELTPRELAVLRLLVTEQLNKEIGARLAITEGTVRAHLNNIFQKLDVHDRTHAATIAIKRGSVRL